MLKKKGEANPADRSCILCWWGRWFYPGFKFSTLGKYPRKKTISITILLDYYVCFTYSKLSDGNSFQIKQQVCFVSCLHHTEGNHSLFWHIPEVAALSFKISALFPLIKVGHPFHINLWKPLVQNLTTVHW